MPRRQARGRAPLETASTAGLQGAAGRRRRRAAPPAQGHHRRVLRVPVPVLQARASPPSKQVLETYGDDVQLAWKHLPAAHAPARPRWRRWPPRPPRAQGKFWEMHDLLFANQEALDRAEPREVRAGAGPGPGPRSRRRWTRSSRATWSTATRSRRSAFGATRHAQLLRQRPRPDRRPALRGVEGVDRRGDQEGRRAPGRRGPARSGCTRSSSKGLEKARPPPAAHELMPKGPAPDVAVRVDLGDAPVRGPRTRWSRWWCSPTSSVRSARGSSRPWPG